MKTPSIYLPYVKASHFIIEKVHLDDLNVYLDMLDMQIFL